MGIVFLAQQGQSLAEHSTDLLPILGYAVLALCGLVITGLGWYLKRIEKALASIDSRFVEMREERKREIEMTSRDIEDHLTEMKEDIRRQLDELSKDVKSDIGEMSKVKQRLIAIEVKLGIPVHVNGDPLA